MRYFIVLACFALLPVAALTPEWTMERAEREWKPMTRAIQHVGVPGYEFQAGVLWDGSLFFGPETALRKEVGMKQEAARLGHNALHLSIGYGDNIEFPDRLGLGSKTVQHSLEDGYLPIPHVRTINSELQWEETVFARLLDRDMNEGMQPKENDVLTVFVTIRVKNLSSGAKNGRLWLHFGDTSQIRYGYKAGQGHELGTAIAHRFNQPLGFVDELVRYVIPGPSKGRLVWHDRVRAPAGMSKPATHLVEWEVPLSPAETGTLHMVVPYHAVPRPIADRILATDFARSYQQVREFYQRLASGIGSIVTPETFINEYVRAVSGQMTQQIGYRHVSKVWMYKTSPNHYEFYWPCNAAKALPTLDLRGLTAYSRPVLRSFVDTQTEDYGKLTRELSGKAVMGEGFARVPGFLGNFGEWTANTLLISHGLEMWALASHYRITRDRKWLGNGPGSPLQSLLDAFDWITKQRQRTMRDENGHKVPHWGLLPAASAHDWLSGNTVFNDAYCIFGMTEAVRLLREIGHPRAKECQSELNDYRACLRQRYLEARDRARRLPMPDGSSIPYVPRDVYELDWAKPDWTYTGYSALRCGALGVFDPHDELVNQAFQFLLAGMPKGEGYYFKPSSNAFGQPTADDNFRDVADPEAPRHYLWRHYVEYETMWPIGMDLFLQRDDLPRFFEWFYNNLAVALHREYRVGVESLDGVPSNAPGEGERWRAVRDMFVNERGGYDGGEQSLWLMQAIPRAWLRPGNFIGVQEMGTHFGGRVNLAVRVEKDASISVDVTLRLEAMPSDIRVRLRSGNGRSLAAAEINGKKTEVLDVDTIRLPRELKGQYHIVGRF